jgi:ribose 1,5-bisphosphokinase PhnN
MNKLKRLNITTTCSNSAAEDHGAAENQEFQPTNKQGTYFLLKNH